MITDKNSFLKGYLVGKRLRWWNVENILSSTPSTIINSSSQTENINNEEADNENGYQTTPA